MSLPGDPHPSAKSEVVSGWGDVPANTHYKLFGLIICVSLGRAGFQTGAFSGCESPLLNTAWLFACPPAAAKATAHFGEQLKGAGGVGPRLLPRSARGLGELGRTDTADSSSGMSLNCSPWMEDFRNCRHVSGQKIGTGVLC